MQTVTVYYGVMDVRKLIFDEVKKTDKDGKYNVIVSTDIADPNKVVASIEKEVEIGGMSGTLTEKLYEEDIVALLKRLCCPPEYRIEKIESRIVGDDEWSSFRGYDIVYTPLVEDSIVKKILE